MGFCSVLETITLDESKAQGNVQISEDKTEMSLSPLGGLNSHALWHSTRASQSFKTGQHYWEVAVGGCESWAVGVVENSRVNGIQIQAAGHEKNMWILECDGNELSVLHNNDFSRVKENNIETLGVFLDWDKGRLKFYHVNTGSILLSFFAQFRHFVYPMFRIRAQKDRVARLKICNLVDTNDGKYSNTDTTVASETLSEKTIEISSDSWF